MHHPIAGRTVFAATLFVALGGCGSNSNSPGEGTGGKAGSGGAPVAGGAPGSGGTSESGGTTGAGGVIGTGGTQRSGGSTAAPDAATGTGGTPGTGGTAAGRGGRTITGDGGSRVPIAGGRTGAGGISGPASGGRTATGGRPASGGATGNGGATAAGGSTASYYLGADISWAEGTSAAAQDNLLSLLKQHGFNAVRLRAFVDPKASDGYDKSNGTCDTAHTIAFGKKVKDLGMALLVDFHYSDNWADPGKQCVPVSWQSKATIDELATAVYDYTKDAITKLIAGGARPEMVQVGNETTPGMLLHVCDSGGQPTGSNKVTGSSSNWTNLGKLLKAGAKGVKDVDPTILTALHIDRCGDKPTETAGSALNMSKSYIDNATRQGVDFDVFGESCYQKYQGDPNSTSVTKAGWTKTFTSLASAYPSLKLMAAEYGPMQREINDVVYSLPNQQGIGTFNWEPDRAGDWNTGHVLFTLSGNTYTTGADVALYDQMKIDYASRL